MTPGTSKTCVDFFFLPVQLGLHILFILHLFTGNAPSHSVVVVGGSSSKCRSKVVVVVGGGGKSHRESLRVSSARKSNRTKRKKKATWPKNKMVTWLE